MHCPANPSRARRGPPFQGPPGSGRFPAKPSLCSPLASAVTIPDPAPSTSSAQPQQPQPVNFSIPENVREMHQAFANEVKGKLILAPLTKGGNLPYRRLCVDFGAEVTMSEMAFAKPLLKGDRVERARLYKASNEQCFGFQVATKTIAEGIGAAKLAKEAGARWLDINCGCPIHEATSRGLGAAMLRKPNALAKMVNGIVQEAEIPVTVKIRTGENEKSINCEKVVDLLAKAGAAVVTIHGRTMVQRYKKPADWQIISNRSAEGQVPIVGNGDVLTHYEAERRLKECHAVMVGRGALIKPWLFMEHKLGKELCLTARERVGIYRKLASYMKEHFGDDDRGKKKAFYFFPWHFSFFHRYRHLPSPVYQQQSEEHPLILTRMDLADAKLGEELDSLPLLERLLRNESEKAHLQMADAIWDSTSDEEACVALEKIAAASLMEWEAEVKAGERQSDTAQAQG